MAEYLGRSLDSREAYPSTNCRRVEMQSDFSSAAGVVLYTHSLFPLMESNLVRKDTVLIVHIQFVVRLI